MVLYIIPLNGFQVKYYVTAALQNVANNRMQKLHSEAAQLLAVRVNLPGCVPRTARILKGALSLPFILKLIKSQTQPDGGEGYSGMATGYR